MKHDFNNVDYEHFHEIMISIFNTHARNTLEKIARAS